MTLSPALAAQLANGVYGIRKNPNVEQGLFLRGEGGLLSDGQFDFGKAKSVGGTSGAGIRTASGFSMVVPCRGAMQGEYIVATRGTVGAADWITDFAAAMEPGPGGTTVHAGFNRVAKSVLREINEQLANKNPTTIHVVGHSLGGAVANILAATFALQGIGVELYTFGAPRPGLTSFRELLSSEVGERNMYRAFHLSDPVPLVPIHPFLHAPGFYPGALCGATHGLVNPTAHFMTSYKPAIGNADWHSLQERARVTPMNIEELLRLAGSQIKMPGASGGLYLLGRILKRLLSSSNVMIGTEVTGGLTLLDQIGLTLTRAQASNAEMQDQLRGFMKYALILAGLPFKLGAVITGAYITHVLTILLRLAVSQANTAIIRKDQDA